ncbi:cation/H(+) antiporter 15-like [Cornus florida]|uniref:cation/H(+) antiporter 15-like n=1 Tax=Cornus florida TaxID=4283 RepID=UPI00289E94A1|nr:cation/H(+) antiporter 15-like [Cornus florida]
MKKSRKGGGRNGQVKLIMFSRLIRLKFQAGIILGPTFLGQIPGFTETLFPLQSLFLLDSLAKTGFILFTFLVGVKMEPSMVVRTGKKVWTTGLVSVLLPILVAMIFSAWLDQNISFTMRAPINNIILTQTISPFAVIACLPNDLKITNSEIGRVALATGLIRELLSLAIHTQVNYARVSTLGGSFMTGTLEGKPVDVLYIGFISCGVLLSATISYFLGTQMFYFGPLILGLAIPVGPPLGSTLATRKEIFYGLQTMPDNAELRICVCVHRQDEALAAIKLLEVSNPTQESPLLVHVLHLMELKGRATPLLINHQFGQKISAASHSRQIIDVFNKYENQFLGLVNVHAFTAISMLKFMHQDICSLAFDKLVSLVILPFHRKWNSNGTMVVDNKMLRSINLQVMELAPCSVGILVDRRKMHRTTPVSPLYRVAVLYLGGDDDREALAYAKRMAQCPAVHLTVLRLVAVETRVRTTGKPCLTQRI